MQPIRQPRLSVSPVSEDEWAAVIGLVEQRHCGLVVQAACAEEALRVIRDGLKPDVLITDHLMPGMNGTELAAVVRSDLPGTPVLIVSGYADVDGIAPDFPRLVKPFRNADLAASLDALTSTRPEQA